MKTLFLLIMIAVGPTILSAQVLKVRTGEHTDFTRVVIEASPDTAWTMTEDDKSIIVRTTLTTEYDLSDAWQRIGKLRINEMSFQNDKLQITKNCNCKTEAYQRSDGLIVLDIKNFTNAKNEKIENEYNKTEIRLPEHYPNPIEHLEESEKTTQLHDINKPEENEKSKEESSIHGPDHKENELKVFKQEILSKISKSATRGLLEPQFQKELKKTKEDEVVESFSALSKNDKAKGAEKNNNMRTKESISTMKQVEGVISKDCEEYPDLDHNNWSETDNFVFEISRRRNDVFDDLANHNDQKVQELARAYLYFGFPEEAIESFELMKDKDQSTMALIEIARIVQGEQDQEGQVLTELSSCSLQAQFWLFLTTSPIIHHAVINEKNIVVQLRSLPTHLKNIVGDQVKNRLINMGFLLEADAVQRSLQTEKKQQKKKDTGIRGQTQNVFIIQNEHLYLTIFDVTQENSIEKIISEVEQLKFQKLTVDKAVLELIDSLLVEYRGTSYWDSLKMVKRKLQIFNGQYYLAIQSIDECSTLPNLQICNRFEDFIEGQYARWSSEFDFLYYFFNYKEFVERVSTGIYSKAMMERLENLGFGQFNIFFHATESNQGRLEGGGLAQEEPMPNQEMGVGQSKADDRSLGIDGMSSLFANVDKAQNETSITQTDDWVNGSNLLSFENLSEDSTALRERILLQLND